jgi:hypothetical protein
MYKIASLLLVLLALPISEATAQTVYRSNHPIEASNYTRAIEATKSENWAVAYRFLEDELSNSNQDRKNRALELVRQFPQILRAAPSTFTQDEIVDSIRRYGETEAIRIERKRIDLLAAVADGATVSQATASLDAVIAARRKQERDQEQQQRALAQQRDAREKAEQQQFLSLQNSTNPNFQYLGAVRYENENKREMAKAIYLAIMDRHPTSPIALKAADRIAALADVRAIERSNDNLAREAAKQSAEANAALGQASREAASRAFQQCEIEETACYQRGGKNCFRDCKRLR